MEVQRAEEASWVVEVTFSGVRWRVGAVGRADETELGKEVERAPRELMDRGLRGRGRGQPNAEINHRGALRLVSGGGR